MALLTCDCVIAGRRYSAGRIKFSGKYDFGSPVGTNAALLKCSLKPDTIERYSYMLTIAMITTIVVNRKNEIRPHRFRSSPIGIQSRWDTVIEFVSIVCVFLHL